MLHWICRILSNFYLRAKIPINLRGNSSPIFSATRIKLVDIIYVVRHWPHPQNRPQIHWKFSPFVEISKRAYMRMCYCCDESIIIIFNCRTQQSVAECMGNILQSLEPCNRRSVNRKDNKVIMYCVRWRYIKLHYHQLPCHRHNPSLSLSHIR